MLPPVHRPWSPGVADSCVHSHCSILGSEVSVALPPSGVFPPLDFLPPAPEPEGTDSESSHLAGRGTEAARMPGCRLCWSHPSWAFPRPLCRLVVEPRRPRDHEPRCVGFRSACPSQGSRGSGAMALLRGAPPAGGVSAFHVLHSCGRPCRLLPACT